MDVTRRVKLTFPQDQIKEPVLFSVSKKYDLLPNIRRARITETCGEMVLEILATEENLDNAIKEFRELGVQTELVEGDVIE